MSLTAKDIAAAKAGSIIRDDVVKGLQLRVYGGGRKSFHVYYSLNGVERRPKIGEYPALPLADARKIAQEYLAKVQLGVDPQASAPVKTRTVEALWDNYCRDRVASKKSADEDVRIWNVYIKPKIRYMLAEHVNYERISELHSSLASTPYQANRVLALLSAMFAFAVAPMRWISTNPCEGVRRYPEAQRRRYYTPHELRYICAALDAESARNPGSVAFLYLLIFTGARKGEIANAKTEWLCGNVLRLPDSKTGAKEIILPQIALDAIQNLPKGEYLVPVADPKKLWDKVRKLAGCPDLRLHDLRHSFASMSLASGVSLSQIGELLGHKSTQTTKRYAHLITDAAETAAETTAAAITELLRI